jgi:hypothetical protein
MIARSAPNATPPERRRFSVRMPRPLWIGLAMVVSVVLAVGLHFGVPIYRQQPAIREIERLGGHVERIPRGPAWFRRLIANEWLTEHMGHEFGQIFDQVESVRLPPDETTFSKRFCGKYGGSLPYVRGPMPTVSDETLACITGTPGLIRLDLRWTNVGDAGVEQISRLRELEELLLEGTDVSDTSGPVFAKLTNLKKLDLGRTKVSGALLVNLKGLTKLETLSLACRRLTTNDVRNLAGLSNLKFVQIHVCDFDCDRTVFEELKRALPSVDIR